MAITKRYNKKKKVYKKKRVYKARTSKNPFRATTAILPRNFPQKMITKMRYAETIRLDPTIGLPSSYIFQANSIWDPNVSGTGGQPMSRDEYAQLYNYYRVLKSRVVATYIPTVGGAAGAMVCGISVQPDTTTVTDFNSIRETKSSHYRIVAGDTNKVTVTNGYNAKKMFSANMGSLNALMSSSPGEGAYYHIYVTNVNSSGDGAAIDIVITIEYTVLLWELKTLPRS